MGTQAILERESQYRRGVVIASILPLLLFVGAAAIQASGGSESRLDPATSGHQRERRSPARRLDRCGDRLCAARSATRLPVQGGPGAGMRSHPRRVLVPRHPRPDPVRRSGRPPRHQPDRRRRQVRRRRKSGVGDIYSLSNNLAEDSSLQSAALIAQTIGVLALIFAMIYVPLWSVRTGLLTRFHGTLGMALGASFILPPLTAITLPALARLVHVLRPPSGGTGPLGEGRRPGTRGRPSHPLGEGRSRRPSPQAPAGEMSSKATPRRSRAWRRTRTQLAASAPKSANASGAARPRQPMSRSCLMILADGAKAETFEALLEAGDLPAISEHVVERGTYRLGTSVFTSTTGPAHIPLLSGCFPGTVGRSRLPLVRPGPLPGAGPRGATCAAELQRPGGCVSTPGHGPGSPDSL